MALADEMNRLENKSKDLNTGLNQIKDIVNKLKDSKVIQDLIKGEKPMNE